LGCYLFWVANYCICVKNRKDNGLQFIAAHSVGLSVSLVAFILFPTTWFAQKPKVQLPLICS
jgi:hypothetical protein